MGVILGIFAMLLLYVRRFKASFDEEQRVIFFVASIIILVLILLLYFLTNRA